MHNNIIFNSIKEYPDMIKICIYREPMVLANNSGRIRNKNMPKKAPSRRSIERTRVNIHDICSCNKFDLFCTFTFDPKRYNSKKIEWCKKYMNTWIRNAKQRHSKHLEYLIIPELHKSGAIHFHALFRYYEGSLSPSGVFQNGREVFNIPHWHFGFSTCCKIDNQEAVSRYISKYITKEMITFAGDKRYYCSQGLRRPERSHNQSLDFLRSLPPLFKHSLFERSQFSSDGDVEYLTIKKSDLRSLVLDSASQNHLIKEKAIDYLDYLMLH